MKHAVKLEQHHRIVRASVMRVPLLPPWVLLQCSPHFPFSGSGTCGWRLVEARREQGGSGRQRLQKSSKLRDCAGDFVSGSLDLACIQVFSTNLNPPIKVNF